MTAPTLASDSIHERRLARALEYIALGWRTDAIAARLGCSVGTLRSSMSLARRALRRTQLDECAQVDVPPALPEQRQQPRQSLRALRDVPAYTPAQMPAVRSVPSDAETAAAEVRAAAGYRDVPSMTVSAVDSVRDRGHFELVMDAYYDPQGRSRSADGREQRWRETVLLVVSDLGVVIRVLDRETGDASGTGRPELSPAASRTRHDHGYRRASAGKGGASRGRWPKSFNEFWTRLRRLGFEEEKRGGGHWIVTHPDHPGATITVSSSASEYRTLQNACLELRRAFGVDLRDHR